MWKEQLRIIVQLGTDADTYNESQKRLTKRIREGYFITDQFIDDNQIHYVLEKQEAPE